jgi:hypothetical protein
MRKLIWLVLLFTMTGIGIANAQQVYSEQQLEEKIKANKILMMYATDAGITGTDLNQFGAPSEEFIVPGNYEDIPERLRTIANAHNVRILPSQVSGKMNAFKFALPILIYVAIPLVMITLLIIINRKLTLLIKLLKKDDKQ